MAGISFDRAASYYDLTRGLPDAVRDRLADLLAEELAGRGLGLEIGVGTGRIAIPLVERGVEVIGADLAPAMLRRLVENSRAATNLPLIVADVTRLPFAGSSVGVAWASHVLHLIPDWRAAVDEVARVVVPGGLFLVDFGGGTPAPWSQASDEIMRRRGVTRVRPGASSPDVVADHLGPRAAVRALPSLTFAIERTLGQDLDEWVGQIQSWTWLYTPDQLSEVCEEIRDAAPQYGWSLDEPVTLERVIQWWAFDLA